ncbi:porin family protein [Hymenobacter arizonensis]|uniref:Outer membrane protein beta-barrel domain-containing protein n=1 Tax=Hymenobacter arizonensis TaxID=1227077 RepID=A0A1I5YBF7_HYMAR|nr:porin family protein [Hymenobacter arizonensis]SFQ41526.1 Outer membrane protein beta-barrel domain-containing protein [Hymenobacter arizonensis]
MKKIIVCLGLLTGFAATAQGQNVRYGFRAGVNLATLTNYNVVGVRRLVGATAGVMADAALSDKLSLHPELLFSQKGLRLDATGPNGFSSRTQTGFNYLDLPVLLRLKFQGLYVEAGPQAGYLLNAETTDTRSSSTVLATTTTTDATEYTRRLDLGYVVGVGYQLPLHLEVGVRYNGGIRSTYSGGGQARNSVVQFQLGYLFGE